VKGWARSPEDHYDVIPATTLDTVAGTRFAGLSLLIKIDVEGFELQVLRGGEQTLSLDPKPTWLVEIVLTEQTPAGVNPNMLETFETFWRHGYEARVANEGRRVVGRADVERWLQTGVRDFGSYNYLFVRI
jgi:hypothetical protein